MHDAKYVNHPILSERSGDNSHVGSSLELLFGSDLQWPPTGYLDDPAGWGLLVCSPSHREHLLPCLSRLTRQGEAVIQRPHLHLVVVHKHLGMAVQNYIPPICEGVPV